MFRIKLVCISINLFWKGKSSGKVSTEVSGNAFFVGPEVDISANWPKRVVLTNMALSRDSIY